MKKGKAVGFLLAGSVLLQQPGFARKVSARLRKLWPGGAVRELKRESAWGALALAQRHFGHGQIGHEPVKEVSADGCLLPTSSGLSPTEMRNPRSLKLDRLSLSKAVLLMIEEESKITGALIKERRKIETGCVSMVVDAFHRGGRLFYVGAGTSGRLGILDATECPPTFRTPADRVQGIIAGGQTAIWSSVEGAEDSPVAGAAAIGYRGVNERDVGSGIAASGRDVPFCLWERVALPGQSQGGADSAACFQPSSGYCEGKSA